MPHGSQSHATSTSMAECPASFMRGFDSGASRLAGHCGGSAAAAAAVIVVVVVVAVVVAAAAAAAAAQPLLM